MIWKQQLLGKDDKNVFLFINSNKCNSIEDLQKYLAEKKLPFISKYLFYCFGKLKELDIDIIKEYEEYDLYLEELESARLWDLYLSKKGERIKIIENTHNLNYFKDYKVLTSLLYEKGYEFVEEHFLKNIELYNYNESIKSIREEDVSYGGDSRYCGACMESPCLCSDRY